VAVCVQQSLGRFDGTESLTEESSTPEGKELKKVFQSPRAAVGMDDSRAMKGETTAEISKSSSL